MNTSHKCVSVCNGVQSVPPLAQKQTRSRPRLFARLMARLLASRSNSLAFLLSHSLGVSILSGADRIREAQPKLRGNKGDQAHGTTARQKRLWKLAGEDFIIILSGCFTLAFSVLQHRPTPKGA